MNYIITEKEFDEVARLISNRYMYILKRYIDYKPYEVPSYSELLDEKNEFEYMIDILSGVKTRSEGKE